MSPGTESPRIKLSKPQTAAAFSMLELLVVMAIMVLVAALGSTTFSAFGSRPSQAMELVATMAIAARAEALASGTNTRVAICVDNTAGAKYLRYVVGLTAATNGSTNGWIFSGRGRALPQGTIFWTNYSSTNSPTIKLNLTNTAFQEGTLGSMFVYIEFDATGRSPQSRIQWVFTKAVPDDTGATPLVPKPMDRDGFILRQSGRLGYFRSPGDISVP